MLIRGTHWIRLEVQAKGFGGAGQCSGGRMRCGKRYNGISECALEDKEPWFIELWDKEPWFKHWFRPYRGRVKGVGGMTVISGF
eukprot:g49719.t1